MTLYFAYGSNLNLSQMQRRAPNAVPMDKLYLPNFKLVFRGVADIIPQEGASAPGGLWKLTPADERALDRYEGWRPDNNGMYRKEFIAVDGLPDGETEVMVYIMNSTGIYPPSASYFDGIVQGYRDFGLKQSDLRMALKHAHDEKRPSHVERKRLRRTGRPPVKGDPRLRGQPTPMPNQPSEFVYRTTDRPVRAGVSDGEASRWAETRKRAQEADRASAALKGPQWAARQARRSRLNTLAAWLEEQKATGGRY